MGSTQSLTGLWPRFLGALAPGWPGPSPAYGGPWPPENRYTVLSVPGTTGLLPGAITYGFPLGTSPRTMSGVVPHRCLAPGASRGELSPRDGLPRAGPGLRRGERGPRHGPLREHTPWPEEGAPGRPQSAATRHTGKASSPHGQSPPWYRESKDAPWTSNSSEANQARAGLTLVRDAWRPTGFSMIPFPHGTD